MLGVLTLRIQDLGIRVQGSCVFGVLDFRVQGLGFRVQNLGFGNRDLDLKV